MRLATTGPRMEIHHPLQDEDTQILFTRRAFISSAVLALSGLGGWGIRLRATRKKISQKAFADVTPDIVAPFQRISDEGVILPLEDDLTKLLYTNTRYATYSDQVHPPIMWLVAYDQLQEYDVQIHRPEACYPAAGFQITYKSPIDTSKILGIESRANMLTAEREDRVEQIIYWTRIGARFPVDYATQRIDILRSKFSGHTPDAVLFRASIIMRDRTQAFDILLSFVRKLIQEERGVARKVFLGSSD